MPSSTTPSLRSRTSPQKTSSEKSTAPGLKRSGTSTGTGETFEPSQPTGIAIAADFFLVGVYSCVGFFFIVRWVRFRKWPSLYLAISAPLAWTIVALWDLGYMQPLPNAPLRWVGVVVGLLMLVSVIRWERVDPADARMNRKADPTQE
jgi:hypothetical protein